ncbi:hypothetical protein T492DRAFT_848988 [Pavlovales sp. CCMP2436]|nr:hypothetical protein T492DRAFT_848988 [Pavlovales sp. CCMP2436]
MTEDFWRKTSTQAQVDHRDEDGLLPAATGEHQVNLEDDGKQGPVAEARDIFGLSHLLVASSAWDVLADTSALHRCWPRLRNITRAASGVSGGGDALAGVGQSPRRRHPANVARSAGERTSSRAPSKRSQSAPERPPPMIIEICYETTCPV